MEYRRLGQSDWGVSILGLGASGLGIRSHLRQSQRILDEHPDITLIDTPNVYGRGASNYRAWN